MNRIRNLRMLASVGAAAFAIAGCGGDDDGGSSGTASVGDCIDAEQQVVDCSSSDAKFELVSDQSEPDAIACITIDDPPQEEVEVDGTPFCAEPK